MEVLFVFNGQYSDYYLIHLRVIDPQYLEIVKRKGAGKGKTNFEKKRMRHCNQHTCHQFLKYSMLK